MTTKKPLDTAPRADISEKGLDSRQLAIPGSQKLAVAPTAAAEHVRILQVVRERILNPESPSTRRAYEAAWRRWMRYCVAHGHDSVPVRPGDLVAHLETLSVTHAPLTVRLTLTALASIDACARRSPTDLNPAPISTHPHVRHWLRSWAREHPRAPKRQARALTAGDFLAILEFAQDPSPGQSRKAHVTSYARDRAALLIGLLGGLRGSEISALDVDDVAITSRGLTVRVRRSKTDQEGTGATVYCLPQARPILCAVDAWECWQRVRPATTGAAFVAIERDGSFGERLTVRSVQRMVASRAERAGFSGVSSHTLRRSMATLARERGQRLEQIQRHGRWTQLQTVAGYLSQRELFTDSPTGGLLDVDSEG